MTGMSNRIRYLILTKQVDIQNDTFKIILMGSTYSFNRKLHVTYGNVAGSELPNANGYVVGGNVLIGLLLSEEDSTNRVRVTWNNALWTAEGGSIGPAAGAIVYDDTETDKTILGYLDFGGQQVQLNGGIFTVSGIEFDWTD